MQCTGVTVAPGFHRVLPAKDFEVFFKDLCALDETMDETPSQEDTVLRPYLQKKSVSVFTDIPCKRAGKERDGTDFPLDAVQCSV